MSGVLFYASGDRGGVWVMRCEHGEATSDEVALTFSRDLLVGCFLYWCQELPEEASTAIVSLVALRTLLGRLLELRFGCSCGLRPFALGELDPEGRGGRPC
jgi:hypothetical protein